MARGLIDTNGERVVAFTGKVRNLSRVAELTASIVEMAISGAWRDYRTAVGRDQWREAELDYFLISCDLGFDDVSRVLAWNSDAAQLAPMMDRQANSTKRRSMEGAGAAWHSPTGEGLADRADRLGWLGKSGRIKAPLSERARARAAYGVTKDEHAKQVRTQRIPPRRRRELDTVANTVLAQVTDDDERRYLVDRLNNRRDRPAAVRPG